MPEAEGNAEENAESEPEEEAGELSAEQEAFPNQELLPTPVDKALEQAARTKSFRTRTMSTVLLIACFWGVIYAGHVPEMFLVMTVQLLVAREIFKLGQVAQKELKLPGFRAQQWYFFCVAEFYLHLRFIKNNLLVELSSTAHGASLFYGILKHHNLISYLLYMAGFVAFVLSLKRSLYKYQFGQYAWTHMICLMILLPSSTLISNIFVGQIWFLLPCWLVIINDICAYLAGFFFGRTPLISISPKKTWEGFAGGFVSTVVAAFFLSSFMSHFQWMTCPRKDLTVFGPLECELDEMYVSREYSLESLTQLLLPPGGGAALLRAVGGLLPAGLQAPLALLRLHVAPMQVHAMVLAMFAALIAPFGGFFASGFKRALKIKDFGDTIPGHGGITDRFDCQIAMAMFSYIYYWSYAASKPEVSVGDVLSLALRLGNAAQLELFHKLGNLLVGEGLLPDAVIHTLNRAIGGNHTHAQCGAAH
ncbi:MAG: hypothetical protein WDW36_004601 [Sanguina aurantia]